MSVNLHMDILSLNLTHSHFVANYASVWDIEAGAEERRLRGHDKRVSSLALTSDNKTLFSGSDDGSVV